MKSILKDRELWYDGESSWKPEYHEKAIQLYGIKYTTEITDDVREFNSFVLEDEEIGLKYQNNLNVNLEYNIPEEYKNVDILELLVEKHKNIFEDFGESEYNNRSKRLSLEYLEFVKRDMLGLLKTLNYIIDTLSKNNVPWGVGRGSAVASYVLFVLGVHDVDSYFFDLDMNEFFH